MKIQKKLTILTVIFFVVGALPVIGQNADIKFNPQLEKSFKAALSSYLNGSYTEAADDFYNLASLQPHHRATACLLMAGKSLYKVGKYNEAERYFKTLLSAYPQSRYVDNARYGLATVKYRVGDLRQAVSELLQVVRESRDPKLLKKAERLTLYTMQKEFSIQELKSLSKVYNDESSLAFISISIARMEYLNGDLTKAKLVLNEYKKHYRSSRLTPLIDQVMQQVGNRNNLKTRIGVILPLSGFWGNEGRAVLDGIRFAHDEAQRRERVKTELVILDSESNIVKAIRNTQDLINNHHVKAIIGDLESPLTAAIGAVAAEHNVALIAPTATENGVSSVGSTVFQLNSDLDRKGRALAEYAINELRMKTFATLAPSDDYGQQLVASFSETIDEMGGRILAQSWYDGTPEDVTRQFKVIREAAFQFDSTDVALMVQEAKLQGQRLRERDVPVLSIDGFFMPISYADDIKYLAPQFAQHNIQTQILGGEYYDDLELLNSKQVQPYVNKVIFVSDYYPDETNEDFRAFRTDFRLKKQKTPERWEVFGYDACNLLIDAIENNAKTGSAISKYIRRAVNYPGKKGIISFQGNNGVNSSVNFLQFINNGIIKHVPVIDDEDEMDESINETEN